ncbi:MAG: hypothetical protein SXG53_04105 [Pseudomonadota bacterium]|nr:hypothetical protein [Pseudomonadota bacterium]
MTITGAAGAESSPHGSQNHLAHVARQFAELHTLAPRELRDLKVEFNDSQRIVIAKRVRDGVAGNQPGDHGARIDTDRNITQQMFDDARQICMCLRNSVTQTPVLGSVEYDLESLCDGTRAIRLGQPRSIE